MARYARITKIVEFDLGHRIPNHDSKCKNPHGHRYRLEVTVGGDISEEVTSSSEGMVMDFGNIKKIMTEEIHDVLDHGFVYYKNDAIMKAFYDEHRDLKSIEVGFIPTAENLANWCYEILFVIFNAGGIILEKVVLYETPNSWAEININDLKDND